MAMVTAMAMGIMTKKMIWPLRKKHGGRELKIFFMKIDIERTNIDGLLVIKPKVFKDQRGCFFEAYNKNEFEQAGIDACFVQDNLSVSSANVLRGLHYQAEPYAQGKLVTVIKGSVRDVVVDIRKDSPTYGKHFKITLSEANSYMLWIPPGFAHGFLTLEDDTVFFYKCTAFYNKDAERAILWNDPELAIDWGTSKPLVSEKDENAVFFNKT